MGQYYFIVNLDRKEYINPHELGAGLKMWEICANSIAGVLPYLLGQSTGQGGGDPDRDIATFGRWAGDRVVVVGDYDESDEYGDLYKRAREDEGYKEISDEVRDDYNSFIELDDKKLKDGLEHWD